MQVAGLLLERGIAPARLMHKLGLPTSVVLDADAWLDRRACLRVGPELVRITGDNYPGIRVCELNRIDQFGAWGYGILQGVNLRESLQFAAQHIGLIETGTRLSLDCRGRKAHLVFGFEGELGADPRQHVEASLLFLRRLLDLACEHVPAEVHFAHAKPRGAEELERVFGGQLFFGSEESALVFDRDALSLPLKRPPVVSPTAVRRLPPATPGETGGAVFRVLRERIELERPTVTAVAAALSMNVRTLQRHLAAWELTFDEILDEFRRRRAMTFLRERRCSVTDIAFRLGYSDSAHFTRAVRRWTGSSPRQFLKIAASSPERAIQPSPTAP